jgi:hypothetical protein
VAHVLLFAMNNRIPDKKKWPFRMRVFPFGMTTKQQWIFIRFPHSNQKKSSSGSAIVFLIRSIFPVSFMRPFNRV